MAKYVSIFEASELTGISKHTLRRGVNAGKYPAIRAGKSKNARMMFDMVLLEKALEHEALSNVQTLPTEPVIE